MRRSFGKTEMGALIAGKTNKAALANPARITLDAKLFGDMQPASSKPNKTHALPRIAIAQALIRLIALRCRAPRLSRHTR